MYARVRLYSNKEGEIYRFLIKFYNYGHSALKQNVFSDMYIHSLEWENIYANPVDIANILGVFVENIDDFDINMWVSLDRDIFINITKNNADNLIRYLYERYPD